MSQITETNQGVEQMVIKATLDNTTFIATFAIESGYDNFFLTKVWYDESTNSIKARFQSSTIGKLQGTVKPDFIVRHTMSLSDINDNIVIESYMPSGFMFQYAKLLKFVWDVEGVVIYCSLCGDYRKIMKNSPVVYNCGHKEI